MSSAERKRSEKIFRYLLIFFTFFGALAVCCLIRYSDGDDAFFLKQIAAHGGFFDFTSYLTKTMNGRIAATAMLWFVFKLPIWFWRFCNAFVITAFVLVLSEILSVFRKDDELKIGNIILSLGTFAVAGAGVIGYSCLWITGSVNYLWPVASGLVSIYPVLLFVFKGRRFSPVSWLISFVCGLVTTLSQEQAAAVYVCFLLIILIYYCAGKKEFCIPLAILTAIMIAAAVILVVSPFTAERTDRELRWLPEYATMNLSQKLFITVQWMIHSFTHGLRFVLVLLWVYLGIAFIKAKKYALGIIPFLFSLIAVVPVFFAKFLIDVGLNDLDMTKSVSRAPRFSDLSAVQTGMIAFWIAVLIATLVLILLNKKDGKVPYSDALLFLAALASCAIMFFSPSIYASGERTLFVAAVLLMLTAGKVRPAVGNIKQELLFIAQIGITALLQLYENADFIMKMI